MRFSISRQLRMYHSDIDVLFSCFFDEVRNRQIVASIYMLNDARYTVADPRNTISVLHILPSHTFEYLTLLQPTCLSFKKRKHRINMLFRS